MASSSKENKVKRTEEQEDILIQLIEKNRNVIIDKFQSDAGNKLKSQIWTEIAEKVNSFGPKKTSEQWKRVSFRHVKNKNVYYSFAFIICL